MKYTSFGVRFPKGVVEAAQNTLLLTTLLLTPRPLPAPRPPPHVLLCVCEKNERCMWKARVQWANAYVGWWLSDRRSHHERRPSLKAAFQGSTFVPGVDGRPVMMIRRSGGPPLPSSERHLSFNCKRHITVSVSIHGCVGFRFFRHEVVCRFCGVLCPLRTHSNFKRQPFRPAITQWKPEREQKIIKMPGIGAVEFVFFDIVVPFKMGSTFWAIRSGKKYLASTQIMPPGNHGSASLWSKGP